SGHGRLRRHIYSEASGSRMPVPYLDSCLANRSLARKSSHAFITPWRCHSRPSDRPGMFQQVSRSTSYRRASRPYGPGPDSNPLDQFEFKIVRGAELLLTTSMSYGGSPAVVWFWRVGTTQLLTLPKPQLTTSSCLTVAW